MGGDRLCGFAFLAGFGSDPSHAGQIAALEQCGRAATGPAAGCGIQGDGGAVAQHHVGRAIAAAQDDRWQQVAFDQLAETGAVAPAPLVLPKPVNPERCVHGR